MPQATVEPGKQALSAALRDTESRVRDRLQSLEREIRMLDTLKTMVAAGLTIGASDKTEPDLRRIVAEIASDPSKVDQAIADRIKATSEKVATLKAALAVNYGSNSFTRAIAALKIIEEE